MNLTIENIYFLKNPKGSVKAFATIDLGGIVIRNIPIIDGPAGLHIAPPCIYISGKDKPKRYLKLVNFKDHRNAVSDAILAKYNDMKAEMIEKTLAAE